MNTEITDKVNAKAQAWVCYDAECALCLRWVTRFRVLLEKNGFVLVPLQSAEARAVLRLPEDDLLKEMRVITPGGRVFGGANALVYISRMVCKPVFWLARVPGAMPLLRRVYEFLARHRKCRDGACQKGDPL